MENKMHLQHNVCKPACHNRKAAWQLILTLLVSSASFAATAASNSQNANTRYQAERAVCNSGQSNQARATCLKEAGAALEESRKGRLNSGHETYHQNALIRCYALPVDDQDACRRRIDGEGKTSGSVLGGGLLRELIVPVPDHK